MMEPWKKEAVAAGVGVFCLSPFGNKARTICMRRIRACPAAIQAVQDVLAKYRPAP